MLAVMLADAGHEVTVLASERTSTATAGAEIDPGAVGLRLRGLPAGMRSSMLKDAIAGATLELDAIAGPILRASPDGPPVTRAVVAAITEAAARR